MQSIIVPTSGTDSGPPSTEAYKRAIYKQPPRNFSVQVLPPQKHGNAYSYGMLITPMGDSDRRSVYSGRSSDSGSSGHGRMSLSHTTQRTSPHSPTFSTSSTSAAPSVMTFADDETTIPLNTSYEIWRRWEDCLFFQETLESEYAMMSREKRSRLAAGKGVKKNGVYARDDPDPIRRLHRAASFESLPPGPDPHMIAKDVHAPGLLPRLNKKGTLFRASKETIDTRTKEFQALIEALLRDDGDVPTLLLELRELRTVRDFFGYWRRDVDRVAKQTAEFEKASMSGRKSSMSMSSRASSIFSSHVGGGSGSGSGIYFSPSNISLQLPSPDAQSHEPPTGFKGPRKPAFMQGMYLFPPPVSPVLPASPVSPVSTTSSAGTNSSNSSRGRPRAQTMDIPSTSAPPAAAYASRGGSLDIPNRGELPISAPAGSSFASPSAQYTQSSRSAMAAGGSGSDEGGDSDGSAPAYNSPINSPRRAPVSAPATPEKGNGRESLHGPIIVSLQEGETISLFGDDAGYDFGDLGCMGGRDTHFGSRSGARGLQDLTIREEDESESGGETETEGEMHSGNSDDNTTAFWSKSAPATGSRTTPTPSLTTRGGRRTTGFSSRPAEFDARSVASAATTDSGSSSGMNGTRTPLSSARAAAAHADALRALTGGRSSSPSPDGPRNVDRDGVATFATETSVGSGMDFEFDLSRLSSAPIVLQPPIVDDEDDEDEAAMYSRVNGFDDSDNTDASGSNERRLRSHDSMASVKTFMTTDSANAVIPLPTRNAVQQMRRRSPLSGVGPVAIGMSIPRPASANSTLTQRMSQMTVTDGGDDILDQYFYGMASPHGSVDGSVSPSRYHDRGSLVQSDGFAKFFQSRPGGKLHLPRRSLSPSLPVSARSSVMSTDTSFSIPPPTPRLSEAAQVARRYVEDGPLPSPVYPESIRSARSDDSFSTSGFSSISSASISGSAAALPVKAVWNDIIVAFRVDRTASLSAVRDKVRDKLLSSFDESASSSARDLPENFILGFKAPSAGRVQTLRGVNGVGGRARSSSLSSQADPNALRVLFTEKDWEEAVRSSVPGAKLTLHVVNS